MSSVVLPALSITLLLVAVAACLRNGGAAWRAFAVAFGAQALAEICRSLVHPGELPDASFVDAFYLAFYPAAATGLWLLTRDRIRALNRSLWLDALSALLTGAAVAVGLLLPSAQHDALNMAYPIGDAGLIGLAVASIALTGAHHLRVLAGLVLVAVANDIYVVLPPAGPTMVALMTLTAAVGMCVIASGAGREAAPPRTRASSVMFCVPVTAALINVGLLYALPAGNAAGAISVAALLVGIVRTGVTFRSNLVLMESRRQAITDELTGLANRRRLNRRIARDFDAGLGLLIIDLNRFKGLNDGLGQRRGDRLLVDLGARLSAALADAPLVARVGGDEFAVLVGDGATLSATAERVHAALADPFDVDGLELHVSATIGGAQAPDDAATPDELLQHADTALRDAKRAQAPFIRFAVSGANDSRDRLALGEELRRGIGSGELEVFFQPQACVRTNEVIGAEALVRWRHPARGLLFPDSFLELADELGLIRALTTPVLRGALAQAAAWRAAGHDLSVAVNLALPNLLDPALLVLVDATLAETGVPADRLVLEITEDVVMADPEHINAVLHQLRERGIKLSLDDFGTGMSSLARLRRLPVDEVKLDRSFVMRVDEDPADAAIVRAPPALRVGPRRGRRQRSCSTVSPSSSRSPERSRARRTRRPLSSVPLVE